MDIKNFKAGYHKKGYKYSYFLPSKINHSFIWTDEEINELLEKASFKLGELDSFSRFIPDIDMFILMHIFKEAVISSRIEGTKTNIKEALIEENDISPERRDDWKEVHNYVTALNDAIKQLKKLPLSNRLIRNTHKKLIFNVRGENKNPGEFRRSQNWIGGSEISDAVFIPPFHTELPELLSDFEMFLNNRKVKIPHLVRIAIAHYQFETIHPFLDGNGRIGRLLITLYLVSSGILTKPLLYISEYFEKNRLSYYDNLSLVREKNDLGKWIKFFLNGVIITSQNSISTLKKIIDMKNITENNIIMHLGKRSKYALVLFHHLFKKPIITIKDVQIITGLTPKSANDLVKIFIKQKILIETTGYKRNRIFSFNNYIKLF
ncbi:MAG: Fic family protein [bacterium]|nr:Fic family protein [bacterium]